MAKITGYTGTQLKRDFMEISSPKEYMLWREKYMDELGKDTEFDDDMKEKLYEILSMGPKDPFDTIYSHKELWKKDKKYKK